MGERYAPSYSEQTRVDRRIGCRYVDAERLGGPVKQYGVAERLCGRGEDEQSRLDGKQAEPPNIALFDLAPHRLTGGQPESTGEVQNCSGGQSPVRLGLGPTRWKAQTRSAVA